MLLMVDVTLLELHMENSPFDLNMPFSAASSAEDEDDEDGAVADDASGGRGKIAAGVGFVVVAIVAVGLAKYLGGDDEDLPDVDIETADDQPVGVAVDE